MHCSYPESSPSMRGSICSNTNAQQLPGAVHSPPRQLQCNSKQMDLPALGTPSEKGKGEKNKKEEEIPNSTADPKISASFSPT